MNTYDDSKYGVIERVWFGLPKTWGGECAAGFTFNETQSRLMKRWYPPGPIRLLKLGVMTIGTLGKGEELIGLTVDGTSSVKGTIVASTTSAPGALASVSLGTNLTQASYLSLLASTNVCSTGTVAVFVDFRRRYSGTSWDPRS